MELIERVRDGVVDFFEDRVRIVLVAIVAALAVAIATGMTAQKPAALSAEQQKGLDALVTAVDPATLARRKNDAADATARSVLRRAAIVMETIYSEQMNFRGVPETAMKFDWALVWKTTPGAKSASDQVSVRVSRKADSFELSTTSPSGRTYNYNRDAMAHVARTCEPGCGTW